MHVDSETLALMRIAQHLSQWPVVWRETEKQIRDRLARINAGLIHAPGWFSSELKKIDAQLRLRWDLLGDNCWIVERLGPYEAVWKDDAGGTRVLVDKSLMVWQPVAIWKDETGPLPLDRRLLEALIEGDMWRFRTPADYIAYKKAKSRKVREANERKIDAGILGAVDKLSTKSLEKMIEVETALQTGDTITAHGSDLRFLENAQRHTDEAEALGIPLDNPAACINPGMNPLFYKRPQRDAQQEGRIVE